MLKIILHPNPILRKKSLNVANISDKKIQELVPEMMETMIMSNGVGLAAPQIGQNIRLLVAKYKDKNLVVINPIITHKSILKEWDEEGCLSIPNKYGQVRRPKNITVEFFDVQGQKQILKAKGLLARIIQHEIDHLDGILFIDTAKDITDIIY